MNLLIPMEKGLTGLTVHYGEAQLVVTTNPMTAMWTSDRKRNVPSSLQAIFHGPQAMNDAITAAKQSGYIK